jgi:hypothetical protein
MVLLLGQLTYKNNCFLKIRPSQLNNYTYIHVHKWLANRNCWTVQARHSKPNFTCSDYPILFINQSIWPQLLTTTTQLMTITTQLMTTQPLTTTTQLMTTMIDHNHWPQSHS